MRSLTIALCFVSTAAFAQAADPIKALAVDWQALVGAMQAQNGAASHVQERLQSVLAAAETDRRALAAERAYWAEYIAGLK